MSEMRVGGSIKLKGPVEFNYMDVGGSLLVEGDLTVRDELRLGGSGRIEGNLRARSVRLGGSIKVAENVYAEEAVIGGSATIGGGRISRLVVGGSLKTGKLVVREARIAGEFSGTLIGLSIIVEKGARIEGKITAWKLRVKRNAEMEEAYAGEILVERNAEIEKLSCIKCIIGRNAWIGVLRYVESYEAKEADIDEVERVPSIPELEEIDKETRL